MIPCTEQKRTIYQSIWTTPSIILGCSFGRNKHYRIFFSTATRTLVAYTRRCFWQRCVLHKKDKRHVNAPRVSPVSNKSQSDVQVFPEVEILSILPPYLRIPAVLYSYRAALPRLPLLCQIEMSYPGFLGIMVRVVLYYDICC